MSNPVFGNSAIFGPKANAVPQPGYGSSTATPGGEVSQLNAMYSAPSATAVDTKRLTYDDVIIKTGGLLALLVLTAAGSWVFTKNMPSVWIIAMVVGLGLGLINSFKKEPSPALIVAYAAVEGVFLGGISRAYESLYNGVVPVAVLATVATFIAALALYSSGKVRVTGKFVRWLMIAMAGYLVFSLINMVLIMTGVMDGYGMRSGGLGIVVGLVAVGLAAASLIVDFDSIKRGVVAGVPARYAWSAAFGLLVTLIWLYLEFLRLISIFMGRD